MIGLGGVGLIPSIPQVHLFIRVQQSVYIVRLKAIIFRFSNFPSTVLSLTMQVKEGSTLSIFYHD